MLTARRPCPHCGRPMRATPMGATGYFFCPFCHAEVSAEGDLVAPPTEGPWSIEDVAEEILEGTPRRPPSDESDYRP